MANALSPLAQAITLAGSQTKLAKQCGVTQGAIWKAKKAGRVSADLANAIHKATGGKVAKWDLRPDYWEVPFTP